MMNDILFWLLTMSTFLIGFWLGRSQKPTEDIRKQWSNLTYKANEVRKDITYRNIKPGIVERPSAKRLNEFANPHIEEEKEEMRDALQKGIEPLHD